MFSRLCLCTAQVSRFSRISRMRTSYSYITPFEIQCRIFIIIFLHDLKFEGFLQCRILLLLNLFQTRKEVYKLQIIYLSWINFREDLFSRGSIFARINFREWHFQIFRVD